MSIEKMNRDKAFDVVQDSLNKCSDSVDEIYKICKEKDAERVKETRKFILFRSKQKIIRLEMEINALCKAYLVLKEYKTYINSMRESFLDGTVKLKE